MASFSFHSKSWNPTRKFGEESFAKKYVQQRIEKDNARRLIVQEEAEKKRKLEETKKTEKTKAKKVTEGIVVMDSVKPKIRISVL